jgi:hypothetical protein
VHVIVCERCIETIIEYPSPKTNGLLDNPCSPLLYIGFEVVNGKSARSPHVVIEIKALP